MNDQSLAGRKALVTGGARGIGAEIATALAKAGASVMIGDILHDLARETAGGIAKLGVTAGATKLDVTDDNQWEQAVGATISTLGGFDILINNAGIEITSLVVDIKSEDVLRMCNVNVVGTASLLVPVHVDHPLLMTDCVVNIEPETISRLAEIHQSARLRRRQPRFQKRAGVADLRN